MKQEIIIANSKEFEKKKEDFKKRGVENFHVLSDFDRTVTYGTTSQGRRTETVISQLRSDAKYLGKEYVEEAHKLFDIYHPIEVDSTISLEEKKNKMHEWWKKHFDLIASSGFTKELIDRVVKERPLRFRKGTLKFFSFLKQNKIPLVFLSAAPGDVVIEYLNQNNLFHEDVYLFANLYEFDEQGKAIRVKEPIIHTFNKKEVSLSGTSIYNSIKSKKNVLLLGDSLGDVGMVEGFDYDNLIMIGFLNERIEENLEEFKQNFDVVLTGDQDFSFINKLIEEILK